MWKMFGQEKKRADEGSIEGTVRALIERLDVLERDLQGLRDLPIEWATTVKKLNRLVGHITKVQALDNAPLQQEDPAPRRRSADELTRDEIARMEV